MESSTTEARNPRTQNLDMLSTLELAEVMNQEDRRVPDAVGQALPEIAAAIDAVAAGFAQGGRLIYVGAGTSGRLGVLDAAECPPTFGTDPSLVLGLIAGGEEALLRAVEHAEDSRELGRADLEDVYLAPADVVVGIAASGRTPYVIGALDYANEVGATTVALSCNPDTEVSKHADIAIEVDNGPEILTGSTRLKSGTSQKLVLNMISTGAMVKSGKVFGNLMVDVQPTNEKLVDRAARIVMEATGCDRATAEAALKDAGDNAKTAIVAVLNDTDATSAREALERSGGFVRGAIAPAQTTGNNEQENK